MFSREFLPKIPELKFYLSELFSNITPVPFDGVNLNCAEGRVPITITLAKMPKYSFAIRFIFGPQQNGFSGQSPERIPKAEP